MSGKQKYRNAYIRPCYVDFLGAWAIFDAEFSFEIDQSNKTFLMEGLDDIGLTLKDTNLIDSYEKDADSNLPWYIL